MPLPFLIVGADLSFDSAQDGELVEPCVCPLFLDSLCDPKRVALGKK